MKVTSFARDKWLSEERLPCHTDFLLWHWQFGHFYEMLWILVWSSWMVFSLLHASHVLELARSLCFVRNLTVTSVVVVVNINPLLDEILRLLRNGPVDETGNDVDQPCWSGGVHVEEVEWRCRQYDSGAEADWSSQNASHFTLEIGGKKGFLQLHLSCQEKRQEEFVARWKQVTVCHPPATYFSLVMSK